MVFGTINLLIPSSRPFLTTGSTPLTPVISPPSDSSPINSVFSTLLISIISIAIKILTATGRSYPVPCFLKFAGDKLTVIRLFGMTTSLFLNAVTTLSLDSLTSGAKLPTSSNAGNPLAMSHSTLTICASIPCTPPEITSPII